MYKNIAIYLTLLSLVFTAPALAINPGSYLFRFKNPQSTSSAALSLTPTQPQPANFNLQAGLPEFKTKQDFSLTISEISLDFGILTPDTLQKLSHSLSVSAPHTHGYSLLAFQDHPLQLSSLTTIPSWSADTQTGFGFSFNNQPLQSLPNQTEHQPLVTLHSTHQPTIDSFTSTYQINIPATQAAGDYQNQIYYLALPTY